MVTLIVMVAVYRSDWAQIAKDAIARAETTTPLLGEKLLGDGGGQAGGATGGWTGEGTGEWTGEWTVKKCEVGAGGGAMAAAV